MSSPEKKDAKRYIFLSFMIMWKAVKDIRNGFVGLEVQSKKPFYGTKLT